MTSTEVTGLLKKFRRTPWRFQVTFQTPLKDLQVFVTTIISTAEPIEAGCLAIDKVVLTSENLKALLNKYSLPNQYGHDSSIMANGREEIVELLEAALSDWLDFIFVPTPKPFVIYADHDEYITFYANTKSNLNSVAEALSRGGYKRVENYARDI